MDLRTKDVAAVGRRVAAHQDAALERLVRPSTTDRLEAIYRKEAALSLSARAAPRSRRLGVALAAACVAASVLWFVLLRPGDPLTYRVAGAPGAVGRWVAADASQVGLDFSDGSRVDLAPGTRARVTEVGPRGASVLLERGSLRVRVVHRDDTRWVVAGGPFEVHVIGTEFDITWNTEAEELTVSMITGRVRILGPCVDPSGRALAAPEATRVACAAPRSAAPRASSPAPDPEATPSAQPPALLPGASAAASAPTPAPAPAPAPAPPSLGAPRPRAGEPLAEAPAERWRAHLAAGKLGEALADVELLGIDAVLGRAGGAELVDLGSAARLSRKPDVAARFYEAARQRFAGSDAAAAAAYHLGRMAFDGRGAWAEAERWFAVYLAERPRGALAPEALGRSIECARNLKLRARARELAARYLAAYPNGAHAGLAATLADGAD
ncbi:FecR domain-containing protein [Sorangium sp. So ce145]|uniref:tetratricopeptide repeat protein n=1 Tax=Sorangium sp. So ce145 TaxID=3133285 RepID=UPI003F614B5A